jgi:galactose mutarotase-like enzyme
MQFTLTEAGVKVSYEIRNDGDKDIPFSFGLHPAFKTALHEGEKFEDFAIEFSPAEKAVQIQFFTDLSPVERHSVLLDQWNLSRKDLDVYKTLVFEDVKAENAVLKYKDEPRLKMHFEGYPYLALWSCEKESDYICIEPWFGHADFEKVEVPFAQREGTQILAPGETFKASYSIESLLG